MKQFLGVVCVVLAGLLIIAHILLVLDGVRHLLRVYFDPEIDTILQQEATATIALAELALAALLAWYVRLCTRWFWRLMDQSQA